MIKLYTKKPQKKDKEKIKNWSKEIAIRYKTCVFQINFFHRKLKLFYNFQNSHVKMKNIKETKDKIQKIIANFYNRFISSKM